ncbi:MAG: tRNA (adenosine(37)-N6)-dimethylallyltransferase MiaA [Holosporaceae bacterium]|jgi:tRNA dimethylallyltransferase|nr:tRNA (adenosine(37)-N6)-dimethylallyltransferase MiaA [Holosporaceae bacterium]
MNNVIDTIVIAGPTATGKTRLSLHTAAFLKKEHGLDAEIINADSIQLYKDLKILTAHPSFSEMEGIVHHLFGILDPNDSSDVAFWEHSAKSIIKNLRTQHKIAIICGGTGFYIRTITDGIAPIPEIPQNVRRKIREEFSRLDRDKFLEKLAELDPYMAQRLHKNDTQRILRAYEVVFLTGKSLSEWWRMKREESQHNIMTFFLSPDRGQLRELCHLRAQKMLNSGARDELMDFMARYPDYRGPLSKAIGYTELILFIAGKITETECIDAITTKTRQYAKRQYTWCRHQLSNAQVIKGTGYDESITYSLHEAIFLSV